MPSTIPSASKRVILAYSGGLDTSCILFWLIEQGYEVIAYMANVGQIEDFKAAEEKALKIGAKKFILEDLRKEFIEELVWPAVQANAIYENVYLLGTSLARPVISRGMIAASIAEKADFVSHGCTGKGNDQVRFELGFYALRPEVKVIAPWRLPEFYNRFAGRTALLDYAAQAGVAVFQTKAKPWSTDENFYHISYEAGILEDPNCTPPADMWALTSSIENAPEQADFIHVEFEKGLPVKVIDVTTKKETTGAVEIFTALNDAARKHGIGRLDIVESRRLGLKSRGCYETPAGTILRVAHMDLEGLTLDRDVRFLRDSFVTTNFSKILYNGNYFSPECKFITSCIPESQKTVNGTVRLKLLKGNTIVEGRFSNTENLYDEAFASMDALGSFEPTDSTGYIALEAHRLKLWGQSNIKKGCKGVTPADVYRN